VNRAVAVCIALAVLCSGCTRKTAEKEHAAGIHAEFAAFVDTYFNRFFVFYPSIATAAGVHDFDSKLEDLSSSAVKTRVEELNGFASQLAGLRQQSLTAAEQIDARLIENQIKSELLDLEQIRGWRKNPLQYVSIPGNAVDLLMKRNFAPAHERLRLVIERLKRVEPLLQAMADNVNDPPKEFTELAARIASSSVAFFRDSVSVWAKEAAGQDFALLAEFQTVNRRAATALEESASYLKNDLLPNSEGQYAIGAENYRRKLEYDEMVDIPLDRLLTIGEANLEKDYNAFVETAKHIDAGKSAADVMKAISNEHPMEANLFNFAKSTADSIRKFVVDKRIIAIPSEVRPSIVPTPPYARVGTFASMDTPGPFEAKATEAFYYITPTEPDWTAQHKEEHLRLFNRPVMDIITIHEAYPGHYVQFLYVKQFPTKARKLIFVGSNVEGWAHYAEQMMVEEGFGGGDPKIRLAQLSEALIRDCRYVAGIKLHTQNMTVQQATNLFMEKAFQERSNAYEEARRGTYNPTYLYYTLGKLQIYRLREAYRQEKGSEYSLEAFHSEFVKQGGIPIKLIREILLPGDTGPSL
jgi:uncharacterized protein (DUF885 family)